MYLWKYICRSSFFPSSFLSVKCYAIFQSAVENIKKRVGENSQTRMDSGGDEGDRTPDLLNAIQALSQLSYAPKSFTSDIIRKKAGFVNIFSY